MMSTVASLIHKDLVVEYRSRQVFVTTLFFGLLVLVVGNFALLSGEQYSLIAHGVLWISFLFSGLLFLNHIMSSEKEESTISALLISPASPGQIFLGKMLAAFLFLIGLELVLFPVFHLLFNFPFTVNSLLLFVVIIFAAIGYCSLGVLLSTMSLSVKNREIILSVILFPILIPLLIASVKCSLILMNDMKMDAFYTWFKFLVAFDVIYVVLSYHSYFWIMEET